MRKHGVTEKFLVTNFLYFILDALLFTTGQSSGDGLRCIRWSIGDLLSDEAEYTERKENYKTCMSDWVIKILIKVNISFVVFNEILIRCTTLSFVNAK